MVMLNIDILAIILCKMQEKTIHKQILVTPKEMFRICFQCFNVMWKLHREENIYNLIGICLV